MTPALPNPRTIAGAIIAGIVAGGTILAGFAAFALVLGSAFTLAGMFQFDASALVGKAAYTGNAYVALGIALHFLVAIGWAVGYAWAAERQPQLLTRPLISGAVFGLIVYFAMQFMLFAANVYHNPTLGEFDSGLFAHVVFYGIPIALINARFCRPS
jgi:uncharacterized membrane protein YagU involved in acid resistance